MNEPEGERRAMPQLVMLLNYSKDYEPLSDKANAPYLTEIPILVVQCIEMIPMAHNTSVTIQPTIPPFSVAKSLSPFLNAALLYSFYRRFWINLAVKHLGSLDLHCLTVGLVRWNELSVIFIEMYFKIRAL